MALITISGLTLEDFRGFALYPRHKTWPRCGNYLPWTADRWRGRDGACMIHVA